MNQEQLKIMSGKKGFIAALDQSGGSTPKALKNYGIGEDQYSNDEEMFQLVHEMRTRIITSPSFTSDHILAAILFENTDSSFFRFRISAGSQYTIIMMYAGSSEDFSLSVNRKTLFRIPFKKSDSKVFLYNIFSKCRTQSIKIRMFTVPEFCVRNFHA